MRLGILQPYCFPYLGYYQLLTAVDRAVFYDDVSFIKQGYINRNAILTADGPLLFTIPVEGRSSNKRICDLMVDRRQRPIWQRRILRTIEQSYRRAPHFKAVFPLVESVLAAPTEPIAAMAKSSVRVVFEYLNKFLDVRETSQIYKNEQLNREERLIDICRREGADVYVNPKGGRALYSPDQFAAQGLALRFLESREVRYAQFGRPFVPGLSIIDVLMFNSPERVRDLLQEYDLVP